MEHDCIEYSFEILSAHSGSAKHNIAGFTVDPKVKSLVTRLIPGSGPGQGSVLTQEAMPNHDMSIFRRVGINCD